METGEFLVLIVMPLFVGIVATSVRNASAIVFLSIAVAFPIGCLALAAALAPTSSQEPMTAIVVGLVFCVLPALAAFVVARGRRFQSRPALATLAAVAAYGVVGVISVSLAVTSGFLKP
jgi:hypothetical protein